MFNRFIEFCSNLGGYVVSTIESLLSSIANNRHKILEVGAVFMLCVNPFMTILVYSKYGKVESVTFAILVLLFAMGICVIDASIRETETKHRKRLTRMNRYGDIEIDESDIHEALRLLYDIENEIGVK